MLPSPERRGILDRHLREPLATEHLREQPEGLTRRRRRDALPGWALLPLSRAGKARSERSLAPACPKLDRARWSNTVRSARGHPARVSAYDRKWPQSTTWRVGREPGSGQFGHVLDNPAGRPDRQSEYPRSWSRHPRFGDSSHWCGADSPSDTRTNPTGRADGNIYLARRCVVGHFQAQRFVELFQLFWFCLVEGLSDVAE